MSVSQIKDSWIDEAVEEKSGIFLFSLGEEHYAMDLNIAESIFPYPFPSPAKVAKQPYFVEGFLEIEHVCVPVLNLHALLGVNASPALPTDKVLVVRCEGFRFALHVQSVQGARDIADFGKMKDPSLEIDGVSYLRLDLAKLLKDIS